MRFIILTTNITKRLPVGYRFAYAGHKLKHNLIKLQQKKKMKNIS